MWKRVAMLWTLVRGDARRLWRALRHPGRPGWLRPAVALLLIYLVSPIDLIPEGLLPVLGLADDLLLIPLAVRFLLARLPAAVLADIDARPARA